MSRYVLEVIGITISPIRLISDLFSFIMSKIVNFNNWKNYFDKLIFGSEYNHNNTPLRKFQSVLRFNKNRFNRWLLRTLISPIKRIWNRSWGPWIVHIIWDTPYAYYNY